MIPFGSQQRWLGLLLFLNVFICVLQVCLHVFACFYGDLPMAPDLRLRSLSMVNQHPHGP